jgi:ribosomal protein L37E
MPGRVRLKPWLLWTFLAIVGGMATLQGLFVAGREFSLFGSGNLLRLVLGLGEAIAGATLGIHALLRRQWIRTPGQRCRRCGYDLRASPGRTCSECGAPVGRGQGLSWDR